MRITSTFVALAASVAYAAGSIPEPRYITTSTYIGGLCWENTQGAPVTATEAGVTTTVSVPEVTSVTTTQYVYPTAAVKRERYPPRINTNAAREETTIVVSDVCASTSTITLHATDTVTDPAVTATTTAYESTFTSTFTLTLCETCG